jgi:hypothetical protein
VPGDVYGSKHVMICMSALERAEDTRIRQLEATDGRSGRVKGVRVNE